MLKKYPGNFLILFCGQTISNLGNQIYLIALPWLVYELTQSSSQMGTIAAITALPDVLFTLFVGVLIDRYNKKNILWISSIVQFLLVLSIPVLFLLDTFSIYHIYIIGFCYATTSMIFITTYRSIIPELVDKEYLVDSNSLIQVSLTLIRMVGPLVAGVLITILGEINAFFIDALTFLILISTIYFIKIPKTKIMEIKKTSVSKEIKDGIKYIIETIELRHITWLVLVVNIGMSISMSLMVFHLRGGNNFSATEVGYVYSIAGVMSFFFTIFAPRVSKKFNLVQAISISCCLSGVGLLVLPLANTFIFTGLALGMIIGGASLGTVFIHTSLQKNVPSDYLGRVYASTQMATRISVPVALMMGAWGSETIIGINGMFIISGIIIVASTLFSFFRLNKLDQTKEEITI